MNMYPTCSFFIRHVIDYLLVINCYLLFNVIILPIVIGNSLINMNEFRTDLHNNFQVAKMLTC